MHVVDVLCYRGVGCQDLALLACAGNAVRVAYKRLCSVMSVETDVVSRAKPPVPLKIAMTGFRYNPLSC
jgi:hypothetical protein